MEAKEARQMAMKARKRLWDSAPRIEGKIQDRACKGGTFKITLATGRACKKLREHGFLVLRLPPFALILW